MIKQEINNLNLNIYKETLDNGLLVYICPMEKNSAHASIVTKYGSDTLEFIPRGKNEYITLPQGTAHFLEHKMFETKEGPDPMILYSNNGALSNAYTSSNVTRYYFTGASHFQENLKILLDCITNPYFTKENIEKEQGIITQEINSGLDDPDQRIYYLANKNLFINHPHKYSVVGTEDSISKLTPEMLYDVYNTFYHPSNMYMVITGNIDPEKTIKYIKDYYQNKDFKNKEKIITKNYQEPIEVKTKNKEETMDVTNKILTIAYKVKAKNTFKESLYILIYLDTLFSEMTKLYTKNHHDKNILTHIGYFIENVDDYTIIHLDTEVIESEDILKQIDKEINKKDFTKEDFDLIIKNILKSAILSTENVESVAHLIVNQELNYNKFYTDFYDLYKNINYEECKKYIQNLDFSNYTTGIIKGFDK